MFRHLLTVVAGQKPLRLQYRMRSAVTCPM